MSVLEAMQDQAYWRPAIPYPEVERAAELRGDVSYVISLHRLTSNCGAVAIRLDPGHTIPSDQSLLQYVEDHRYEGPVSHPKFKQARENGSFLVEDKEHFEYIAEKIVTDPYSKSPSAQFLLKGRLPGRWQLYERTQILAVPESGGGWHNRSGQLVGMPGNEILQLSLGELVARSAGSVILPKGVQVGQAFAPEWGAWLSSHRRKVVAAWYHQALSGAITRS